MDKKLIWNEDKATTIRTNLESIVANLPNYEFVVWNEIPEEYRVSLFENESKINPTNETFDSWHLKLAQRPSPLFSAALIEGRVVSSLSSASYGDGKMVNLWHTDENYRGQRLGSGVFLKMLNHINENNLGDVVAWDITSAHVDTFLTNNGFE